MSKRQPNLYIAAVHTGTTLLMLASLSVAFGEVDGNIASQRVVSSTIATGSIRSAESPSVPGDLSVVAGLVGPSLIVSISPLQQLAMELTDGEYFSTFSPRVGETTQEMIDRLNYRTATLDGNGIQLIGEFPGGLPPIGADPRYPGVFNLNGDGFQDGQINSLSIELAGGRRADVELRSNLINNGRIETQAFGTVLLRSTIELPSVRSVTNNNHTFQYYRKLGSSTTVRWSFLLAEDQIARLISWFSNPKNLPEAYSGSGAQVSQIDFFNAGLAGDSSEIQRMIEEGAAVDVSVTRGATALMAASQNGHVDTVRKLLTAKANPNAFMDDGSTALMFATFNGHGAVVEELLANGAHVDDARKSDGLTALLLASQDGHLDVVNLLVAKSANLDARERDGDTPLIRASQNGHLDVVKALLAAGANPNAEGGRRQTALIQAVSQGHGEVVDLLLAAGADVNAARDDGATALIIAAQRGNVDVVKVLLGAGANMEGPPSEQLVTPLIVASVRGYRDVVDELLAANANLEAQSTVGFNALMAASSSGQLDVVRQLLELGADVGARAKDGSTSLILASAGGHADVASLLLDAKADVDTPDDAGVTPLMMASKSGHLGVVKALLKAGADLSLRDKGGLSALDTAEKDHRSGVIKLLRYASASMQRQDPNLISVELVQEALSDRGFDAGSVDGRWGPKTRSALKAFQQAEALPPSGQLDADTVERLFAL